MTLQELMQMSEDFTDETQTQSFGLSYANEALATISTRAGLLLPFISNIEEAYTALPKHWLVRLLSPYLSYGVKMNDASLSEAREYREKFELALMEFKDVAHNVVAEEFHDPDSTGVYQIDTSLAIDIGWFGGW